MHIFYKPEISGDSAILDEQESKHCIRVLRLGLNDQVIVVDGKGGFYTAEISDPSPKKCKLQVIDKQSAYGKKDFYLHIAMAPTKNIDRFEWFLEKATEIGIDEISPFVSYHSERKVIKNERLEKVLISAMKQSVKAYLPKLNEIESFQKLISKPFDGQKFIAHCNEGNKELLKHLAGLHKNILILIGPEGDFSVEEVQEAVANGFQEISLGDSRLRTETAGVVACHTVNLINE